MNTTSGVKMQVAVNLYMVENLQFHKQIVNNYIRRFIFISINSTSGIKFVAQK